VLWPVEKRIRYASVRERMAGGYEGSRMRRIKGARHAHKTIRASGHVPGEEARAARKVKAARRREEKAVQAIIGKQWRYGNVLNNV
jgi:hypothetical protein